MAKRTLDPEYVRRVRWFNEARFGMFIHFGLYSLLERGEWVMFNERIKAADYAKLAREFHPRNLDLNAWADLAHEAGMKYMVLTTRHHDGFCLFDSRHSKFSSVNTPCKRDIVGEYVEACRNANLKVGLYYSLLDWRAPGYFEPGRYPKSARELVETAHAQVRELMSNYGKIDLLWFDGGWIDATRHKQTAAAFWRAKELVAMVRKLQPGILINNRSGVPADLDTPEQQVTASEAGRGWEACLTMSEWGGGGWGGWGYVRHAPNQKSTAGLLQSLSTAAAGGGNLLLNVGPKPDGTIRKSERNRLLEMGAWLRAQGEAIYDSERCALSAVSSPGVWTTRRGERQIGYLHLWGWPAGVDNQPGETFVVVPRVKTRAVRAELLATGQRLRIKHEANGRLVIAGLPVEPPHPDLNVLKVWFISPPRVKIERNKAGWLTGRG